MFQRLLASILVILAIFGATRALVRALPGDPVEAILAESGTSMSIEALRRDMNLDRPFFPALAEDAKRALHGDFGSSLVSREPVGPLIGRRLVNTLQLSLLAMLLGLVASISLGCAAARRPSGVADRACTGLGALCAALPTPWSGPLLILAFAVWIPVFDVGRSVMLPAIALAVPFAGLWSRLVRNRVSEVLRRGAAQGARARGLPEWRVVVKYGLAPASGALAAYLGTQFGGLLAGTVITEVIFDWRGLGSLLVDATLKRDYPVVEAGAFLTACFALGGAWLGDFAQRLLDPRDPSGGAT